MRIKEVTEWRRERRARGDRVGSTHKDGGLEGRGSRTARA